MPFRINEDLQKWINVLGGGAILIFVILGAIKVLQVSPKPEDFDWMKVVIPFVPCLLMTFIMMLFKIISSSDISGVVALLLIFIGLTLLVVGAISDDATKEVMLASGGGVLGLGLGIPFGNSLNKRTIKRTP